MYGKRMKSLGLFSPEKKMLRGGLTAVYSSSQGKQRGSCDLPSVMTVTGPEGMIWSCIGEETGQMRKLQTAMRSHLSFLFTRLLLGRILQFCIIATVNKLCSLNKAKATVSYTSSELSNGATQIIFFCDLYMLGVKLMNELLKGKLHCELNLYDIYENSNSVLLPGSISHSPPGRSRYTEITTAGASSHSCYCTTA